MKHGKRRRSAGQERWTATDAANYVFDRFDDEVHVDRMVQELTLGGQSVAGRAGSSDRLKVRASIARVFDGYADVFMRLFYSVAADLAETVPEQPSGDGRPEPVLLLGRQGSRTGAVLWIHNLSGAFVPDLTLRLTDLWHANGSRLGAELGTTDPERLEGSVERRRSAWISFSVPSEAVRGTYHGHVLANGLPDAAVPIKLIVR